MKAPPLLERDFQAQVIQLAHIFGWRIAHFRPAKTSHGWRTAVGADGAGFPDLVLARDRVVFIELKSDTGRLRDDQTAWHEALTAAGAEAYVFRPSQWDELQAVLSRAPRREAEPA